MAFVGAKRMWDGNDFIATSYGSTWRISRTGKGAMNVSELNAQLQAAGSNAPSRGLA